jgi:hypothetical protein
MAQVAQLCEAEFGGDVSDERLRQEMLEQMESDVEMSDEQFVEQRSSSEAGHERLERVLHALGGGIARLERKLDRILALVTEARVRNR